MAINYRLTAMIVLFFAFLYGAYVTRPTNHKDESGMADREEGLIQKMAKVLDPQYQDAYMREQRQKYKRSLGLSDEFIIGSDYHKKEKKVTNIESEKSEPTEAEITKTNSKLENYKDIGGNKDDQRSEDDDKLDEKSIYKVVRTTLGYEGHNSCVRRSIGIPELRNFSPFLMLDHFSIAPEAGFPDHPHRGQETITYVLYGAVDHEDFTGSRGTLREGDLQFMTAGRGVVHAEMPHLETPEEASSAPGRRAALDYTPFGGAEHVEGLQLWVDLPVDLKECEPRYRDLKAAEIPTAKITGDVSGASTVKVISGRAYGVSSLQDLAYTPVWMLDYVVQPPAPGDPPVIVDQRIPAGFNSFVYILSGDNITISGRPQFQSHTNIFFTPNRTANPERIRLEIGSRTETTKAYQPTRFIVVAGQILDQSIVQHGPFVETSHERIVKAFQDYRTFSNGFERALGWASEIGRRILG
ncbi:hypothetical protein D0Z03_000754 [Geotrichum reessii]|nr:hypothetical protein D0Z03_000754 [Galactomyces reessii]